MNRRLAAPDHSLNSPLSLENGDQWQDLLEDETKNQETILGERQELEKRRQLLKEALGTLNERERHIFLERRLSEEPQTLEELSLHYKISRERVRQIEVRAFEKVQNAING